MGTLTNKDTGQQIDLEKDHYSLVVIKAEDCYQNNEKNWVIKIKSRPLQEADRRLIATMFPLLSEQVYELLAKEILLSAIVPNQSGS